MPYTWNGNSYNTTGTYTFNTTTGTGADSIAVLLLSVFHPDSSTTTIAVDSASLPYTWNGSSFSSAGTYTFNTNTVVGCDSLATLKLIVFGTPAAPVPAISYTTPNVMAKGTSINPLSPVVDTLPAVTDYAPGLPSFIHKLAVDDALNVYVVNNGGINKIAPDGSITVITLDAPLNTSAALAVDKQGNIYTGNIISNDFKIKKTSPDGSKITTLLASFRARSFAIDAAGNLYAAGFDLNSSNQVILKITPAGIVSTIFTWSSFGSINAIAWDDATGSLFTNITGDGLSELTTDGTLLRSYPYFTGLSVNSIAASRDGSVYVAADQLYKINASDHSVAVFSSNSTTLLSLACDYFGNIYTGGVSPGIQKIAFGVGAISSYTITPALPAGLILDSVTGIISGTPSEEVPKTTYTVIAYSHGDTSGASLTLTVTNHAGDALSYNTPNAYQQNKPIKPLAPVAAFKLVPQAVTVIANGLQTASGITSDGAGKVYVAVIGDSSIRKLSAGGDSISAIKLAYEPAAIASDAAGNLYVADYNNSTINKIPANGGAATVIASGYSNPHGIALDRAGDVFVLYSASGTGHVIKIHVDGSIEPLNLIIFGNSHQLTVAADGTIYLLDYGRGVITRYSTPNTYNGSDYLGVGPSSYTVAVDASGNMYIKSDLTNDIQRISPNGQVTTSLGDAPRISAIHINSTGDIYFTDAIVGQLYIIQNANKAITDYSISPALPNGLVLNPATGIITGTPTTGAANTTYTVTAASLLDNIDMPLDLKVTAVDTSIVAACTGSLPYNWNGSDYTVAGTYNTLVYGATGVDTNATLILKINEPTTSTTFKTICSNISFNWNNVIYTTAGSYIIHLTNAAGCDSTATLILTVNQATASSTPVTICALSLPYTWNGNSYAEAGTYTYTTTNAAGCDSVATLVLTVNQPSGSSAPVTICAALLPYTWNGNSYTEAGTYTYTTTNAAGCDSVATLVLTVSQATSSTTPVNICSTDLPYHWNGHDYNVTGNYMVHLTNAAGCDSAAILVLTANAAPATATLKGATASNTVCFGNSRTIIAAATGGATPYRYSLDGTTYQASTNFVVHVGTYTVTVKDAASCILATNSVTITQPAIKLKVSSIQANGGNSIVVNATGGFAGYTYSLNNAAYQPSNIFAGITGASAITVKDLAGCTATGSVAAIIATVRSTTGSNNVCYGAGRTITASAAGGFAPYQYSLNGGAYQASGSFVVKAGTYTITVMDAAGITGSTGSITITQPAAKLAVPTFQPAGSDVTVIASGGFGGYTYSSDGVNYKSSNEFSGLTAGTAITVKDLAGCTATGTLTALAATLKSAGNNNNVCYGYTRTITATTTGGFAPYQYSVDGGTYQAAASFVVHAGSHTVTVMDAAGATVTTNSVTISQPAAKLGIALTKADVSCNGANDGGITASAIGSFGSYLYSTDSINYQASGVFSNLHAGAVKVYVKDAISCAANKSVTITQPATPCESLNAGSGNPTSANAGMVGELKVKVLPNPAVTNFILTLQGGDDKKVVELRVMDMQGRTVYQTRGSVFDLYKFGQTFANGMYIAEVLNGKYAQRIKLVKGN